MNKVNAILIVFAVLAVAGALISFLRTRDHFQGQDEAESFVTEPVNAESRVIKAFDALANRNPTPEEIKLYSQIADSPALVRTIVADLGLSGGQDNGRDKGKDDRVQEKDDRVHEKVAKEELIKSQGEVDDDDNVQTDDDLSDDDELERDLKKWKTLHEKSPTRTSTARTSNGPAAFSSPRYSPAAFTATDMAPSNIERMTPSVAPNSNPKTTSTPVVKTGNSVVCLDREDTIRRLNNITTELTHFARMIKSSRD